MKIRNKKRTRKKKGATEPRRHIIPRQNEGPDSVLNTDDREKPVDRPPRTVPDYLEM